MKRTALFLFLIISSLPAQVKDTVTGPQKPLFLSIVLPESDTVFNSPSRYRLAASTNVTSRAFINGTETTVYPTGAFVGLYQPKTDTSTLTMTVVGTAGDSLFRSFVFIRAEPMKVSPRDTLVIEEDLMLPGTSMWLMEDDVLELRFKGSPGWEATYSIPGVVDDLPMRELPASEARGMAGVYVAKYVVRNGDRAVDVPVEFRLKESFWSSEYATTRARVSILPDSLPRTGEVVGRKPFMNVGLGRDRLGGAKLGYIEPGARVNITGMIGGQYRIRLSESLIAWIPDNFVRLLPADTPPPSSLTGSISVDGTDSTDIVYIGLSERLPYTIDQVSDPTRVHLDIFGATSNTNWITHHLTAVGIRNVAWKQIATDHYRLIIELKHGQHWGTAVRYQGTGIQVTTRRPPTVADSAMPFAGMLIVLDAGHGGESRGALGATGIEEKTLNLALIQQLDSVIQARGGQTMLTRTSDADVGMTDRAEKIVASGADILVSIHCNSTGLTSDPLEVSGTAMFYRYPGFKPLADLVFAEMMKTGLKEFGVVGSFNFSLNGPTELPNVLVETAFMSNPLDEMFLLDPAKRTEVAVRVADGVGSFIAAYGARPTE